MANWKVFEVNDLKGITVCCYGGSTTWTYCLDEYVEFADGYKKVIYLESDSSIGLKGDFIEIDLDQTILRKSDRRFSGEALRKIPKEVAIKRRMERVASADPTALAITREGAERVIRGEISEFEYKMVDNSGNNHHWIYRK